jgi:hypothetical protein
MQVTGGLKSSGGGKKNGEKILLILGRTIVGLYTCCVYQKTSDSKSALDRLWFEGTVEVLL